MPKFLKRLKQMADLFRPEIIVVENNAVQQAVIDLSREQDGICNGLPIRSYSTGAEKMDIEIGLPGMAAEFAAGIWHMPYGGGAHSDLCQCNLCLFVQECRDGTNGTYTDILMAAWLATRFLTRRAHRRQIIETVQREPPVADWGSSGTRDRDYGVVAGGRRGAHYDPGW